LPCEGGSIRAVISTSNNQANPVALHDQIEAQTHSHLRDTCEWYSKRVEENPDSDELERYVNLIGHIVIRFPEEYFSNLLARAVQDKVTAEETYKRIASAAEQLSVDVRDLVDDIKAVTAERDLLRDLVIQYQSATNAD
jgi:hypothetical protein